MVSAGVGVAVDELSGSVLDWRQTSMLAGIGQFRCVVGGGIQGWRLQLFESFAEVG